MNPQRVVRKMRVPKSAEVVPSRPYRRGDSSGCDQRDATIISVLAYAGLRPGELRILRWIDVRERTLLVEAPKTSTSRSVRLLAPLAEGPRRVEDGAAGFWARSALFPSTDGSLWTANGFEKWRRRCFQPKLALIGLDRGRPYDLRHSFASLLLHEGRSVIYVARQLGHGAELTMRTYGHVIDELEDRPQLPAEDAIQEARQQIAREADRVGSERLS